MDIREDTSPLTPKKKPATGVQDFTAQVIVLNHPGQVSRIVSSLGIATPLTRLVLTLFSPRSNTVLVLLSNVFSSSGPED